MSHCIFTTFDDHYFFYAKVCLLSLDKNYPDHPLVKVYYTGQDPLVIDFISGLPNVEIMDHLIDMKEFDTLNLGVIGSAMIYVRFILWSDLFDKYENVIYLDCDTIILKPFPEILDVQDFFAVSDNSAEGIFRIDYLDNKNLKNLLNADGLNLAAVNKQMLNSGFFVLPKKYRTKKYLNQIWEITRVYNNYTHHSDQSVISIWCHVNKIPISNQYYYNFQIGFIFTDSFEQIDLTNIRILHFSYWKPNRNFDELLLRAEYVVKAHNAFQEFALQQAPR